MLPLKALHDAFDLRAMVATSFQAAGGAGQKGIDELAAQVAPLAADVQQLCDDGATAAAKVEHAVHAATLAFNVVPLLGTIGEEGYTDEELKLRDESRKILSIPDLAVSPTCVRVPVMVGHGVAVRATFAREVDLEIALDALRSFPNLVVDDIPTPLRLRRPRRGRRRAHPPRPRRPVLAELLRRRRQPAQGRGAEHRAARRGPARARPRRRARSCLTRRHALTAKGSAWPVLAVTLALLAVLGLAFWFVEPLRAVATAALEGEGALVRSRTHDLGAAGALVLLALVLAHAAIPYPAELTTAAAGYVYGFGLGFGLMMVSWFLTALLAYELAREVGRPVARRAHRRAAPGEGRGVRRARRRDGPHRVALRAADPVQRRLLRGGHHGRPAPALRLDDASIGIAPFCLIVTYLGSRLQTVSITDWRLWLVVARAAGGAHGLPPLPASRRRRRRRALISPFVSARPTLSATGSTARAGCGRRACERRCARGCARSRRRPTARRRSRRWSARAAAGRGRRPRAG